VHRSLILYVIYTSNTTPTDDKMTTREVGLGGAAWGPGGTITVSISRREIRVKVGYVYQIGNWKFCAMTPSGQILHIEGSSPTDNKSTEPTVISYAMLKCVAYFTIMNCFRKAVPTDLLADKFWMFHDVDYDKKLVGHYNARGKEHGPCYLCYLQQKFPHLAVMDSGDTTKEMLPRWIMGLLARLFTT